MWLVFRIESNFKKLILKNEREHNLSKSICCMKSLEFICSFALFCVSSSFHFFLYDIKLTSDLFRSISNISSHNVQYINNFVRSICQSSVD